MRLLDLEYGTSNTDQAEDCKINPSKLLLEAVPEDDESSEEDDRDVNNKFTVSDAFCGGNHDGDVLLIEMREARRTAVDMMQALEVLMRQNWQEEADAELDCLREMRSAYFRPLIFDQNPTLAIHS